MNLSISYPYIIYNYRCQIYDLSISYPYFIYKYRHQIYGLSISYPYFIYKYRHQSYGLSISYPYFIYKCLAVVVSWRYRTRKMPPSAGLKVDSKHPAVHCPSARPALHPRPRLRHAQHLPGLCRSSQARRLPWGAQPLNQRCCGPST